MRSGVPLLMLSMAITPLGDGLSKALAQDLGPLVIAGMRYLVAGLLALGAAWYCGRLPRLNPSDVPGLLARTVLVMAAMTSLIAALALVPLAQAVGGFLIAPVCATLLGAVVLSERLTLQRITGTAMGFLGAVILLRPSAGIDAGNALALFGGLMLGVYLVATRRARDVDPTTTLIVQCLAGGAMVLPLGLALGDGARIAPWLIAPAVALALVTLATHFLTVAAYARSEVGRLSPILYFNLIAAWIVGIMVFSEVPDARGTLGVLAIALGGLITAWPRSMRDPATFGPNRRTVNAL